MSESDELLREIAPNVMDYEVARQLIERGVTLDVMAAVVAARRLAQEAHGQTLAKLEEVEDELSEAKSDLYDPRTGLLMPAPAARLGNKLLARVGGDRLIDPIGAVCFKTDIVGFKKINEKLKFEGGNAFLKAKAEFLNTVVRDTDVLTRWGGDEFIIMALVFKNSSAEEVKSFYESRLYEIPQAADFPEQIRWDSTVFSEGDSFETMAERLDVSSDEGKEVARESNKNEFFSI